MMLAISCNSQNNLSDNNDLKSEKSATTPNIILLVGDGMGLTQISSLYAFENKPTSFDRFKNIGFIKTASSSHKVTDSAAGATAFSAGKKSYNNAIGVDQDTVAIENIVETLSRENWNTGLVSTSSITHATPASFFAHTKHRNMEEEIAAQMPTSGIDLFIGGGLKFFSKRADSLNYLDSLNHYGFKVQADTLGYSSLENTNIEKEGEFQKRAFLMAENGMLKHAEGRGDFLQAASNYAIQELSREPESFFLMIEGSQIDWGGHANDSDYILAEMKDFDKAINAALDFAEKDGNTLVVVTADHETGGYALAAGQTDGKSDYDVIEGKFSTGGHTAALVPVFAYGPGADRFNGIYENTAIYDKMIEFVKENN